MKIAYFDCFSGISGDMTLGAFMACGVPVSFIKEKIAESLLDETSFDIKLFDKKVSGISAKSAVLEILDDKKARNFF